MYNEEQTLEGGVVTKRSRAIFYNDKYLRTEDWLKFNYIEPFDKTPGRINNAAKLQYVINIQKAKVTFDKADLYKRLNNNAYYCNIGDSTLKLVDLTSIKITEFVKRLTTKKGGNSLADALFQNYGDFNNINKAEYLNKIVNDILDMSKSKERGEAYKEILANLNVKSLSELLNNKIQTGGNYGDNNMDGYVPIGSEDIDPSFLGFSSFSSLIGGELQLPKVINLGFKVEDSRESYMRVLEFLTRHLQQFKESKQTKEFVDLKFNQVLVINESIIGPDVVDNIYF